MLKLKKIFKKYKIVIILFITILLSLLFILINNKDSFQTRTPIYSKLTDIYMPYEYIAPSYNSSQYPSSPTNFVTSDRKSVV